MRAGWGSRRRRWGGPRPGATSLIVVLTVAACSSTDQSADANGIYGPWTADTVQIADTTIIRTISGSVWGDTMVLVPEVEIGVLDGEEAYVFGRIGGVEVAPNGDLWLADSQAADVRVFTREGDHVRTVGRQGHGPGEFANPGTIRIRSDGTVIVRDYQAGRFSFFDADGVYQKQLSLANDFVNVALPFFLDEEGQLRFPSYDPSLGFERPFDHPRVVRYELGEELADTIVVPLPEFEAPAISARSASATRFSGVPFWPEVVWTFDRRDRFVIGTGDTYRLDHIAEGRPQFRVERAADRPPVVPEEAERRSGGLRDAMRGLDPNWSWNGPDIPDQKPYFNDLRMGKDGTLWVTRYAVASERPNPRYDPDDPRFGAPMVWVEPVVVDVFDPEGRYLGPVRFPEDSPISPRNASLSATEVWAPRIHELGYPQVVRYRLEPQGS